MNFRIADTFTASLAKLTGDEQKAVKTTAFDLQLNPAHPGMQFHKLNAARDPNFWSVRVSRDIRLIVHRSADSLLLCYVDHHNPAYQWAERRKLQTHPKTGAAQLVEIRETVHHIVVPNYTVTLQPQKPPLFATVSEDELLGFGVPVEWLDSVRSADEDQLLDMADHLPSEAAEALLELATGGWPRQSTLTAGTVDPFEHPDAQRRFRVMTDASELARALDAPWEQWVVFLHPAQRTVVEKDYKGPARVSGSAGTGKSIVALHRAVYLARRHPDARVLLTTFSDTLANALRSKLRRLISHQPGLAERLEVQTLNAIAERLYRAQGQPQHIITREQIHQQLLAVIQNHPALKLTPRFLFGEWEEVVDAWQLHTWEDYRNVKRLGRKTRLSEPQRRSVWEVLAQLKSTLSEHGWITPAQMVTQVAEIITTRRNSPFDFVVVDEAQDLSVAQLRLLTALDGERPNALFFAGDLGQRIFQTPFSWKALGVDVRGRSQTLRINYRTSHQIRRQADRLLGSQVADVDGNREDRRGTISVFNGPEPDIRACNDSDHEIEAVSAWISERIRAGIAPHEIGLFVRSSTQIERATQAVRRSGVAFKLLDDQMDTHTGRLAVSTMHLAKGLEFRAVVVMACDDEVIPLQARMASVADDADLQNVYDTERYLLYVACTRARDYLLVTGVEPISEFLDDLQSDNAR